MELAGASAAELAAYKAKGDDGGDGGDGGDGDEGGFELPEGFALAEGEVDEAAAADSAPPGVKEEEGGVVKASAKKIEETVFPHEMDKPKHMRRPFSDIDYPVGE